MSTSVKYFHSDMPNAPVLSGAAGAMIALLDACLVNGFGLRTVDSITVSGGVATATIAAGHSFVPDSVALIAGAVPAGLNGEKRVLVTTTNTFTFDATGISNTTATGSITAIVAPVGWQKPFSGTNVAAYRSADPTGTREFLRVDDVGTLTCRVVGYESMTSVDPGTGPFPTNGQVSGGYFWDKSDAANATARRWTLVADSRTLYLSTYASTTAPEVNGITRVFGDFTPRRSGDPFACTLSGSLGASNPGSVDAGHLGRANADNLIAVARSFSALGGAVLCGQDAASGRQTIMSGSQSHTSRYPNGADNGLVLVQHLLYESAFTTLRGDFRGIRYIPQNMSTWPATHRQVIDGQGDLFGRRILVLRVNGARSGNSNELGALAFDLTGPWG